MYPQQYLVPLPPIWPENVSMCRQISPVGTNTAGKYHSVSLDTSSGFILSNIEIPPRPLAWQLSCLAVTPPPSPPPPDLTISSYTCNVDVVWPVSRTNFNVSIVCWNFAGDWAAYWCCLATSLADQAETVYPPYTEQSQERYIRSGNTLWLVTFQLLSVNKLENSRIMFLLSLSCPPPPLRIKHMELQNFLVIRFERGSVSSEWCLHHTHHVLCMEASGSHVWIWEAEEQHWHLPSPEPKSLLSAENVLLPAENITFDPACLCVRRTGLFIRYIMQEKMSS